MLSKTPNRYRCHGTTLLEMLAVLVVITVMAITVLPRFARGCTRTAQSVCFNNLKNIGLGFRSFAVDYGGAYPWQVPENFEGITLPAPGLEASISNNVFTILACLSNELSTPKIIFCEADHRRLLATNTWAHGVSMGSAAAQFPSYFLGTESYTPGPQSIVAGDRHLLIRSAGLDDATPNHYNRISTVDRTNLNSDHSAGIAWNTNVHKDMGNLLFGDGHVEGVRSARQTGRFLTQAIPPGTNSIHLFFPALSE